MTRSTNKVVAQGLPGLIDLLIFIQKNGITLPGSHQRSSAPASAAQRTLRTKFQQAVYYAQSVLANEPLRLLYNGKATIRKTAFNLAIADFCKPPQIGNIDVSGYHGQPGDLISIAARDDFQVVAVKVRIENSDGSLSEAGDATLQADGTNWMYTAIHSIEPLAGTSITVTAGDIPGHFSSKQKII